MEPDSKFKKLKMGANGKSINTVIGRGSVSEGRFRVETGVRVDGVLKGELISSGTLIVGESGVIEGDLKVHDALVSGRIVGTLEAEGKVHLQAHAAFVGRIMTRTLIVEEGAIFKAECDAGGEIQVNEEASDESSRDVSEQNPARLNVRPRPDVRDHQAVEAEEAHTQSQKRALDEHLETMGHDVKEQETKNKELADRIEKAYRTAL
jgi:cytoskeletal protein CcmA (bactofilin family)